MPELIGELQALREEQAERRRLLGSEYQNLDLVFCQLDGKPLHAHNIVRRDFHQVLQEAGLPRIRFHDLRHTMATLHLRNGAHPKVVQEMLGHASISMTLDIYSHVLEGMQEEAVASLQDRLFAKR